VRPILLVLSAETTRRLPASFPFIDLLSLRSECLQHSVNLSNRRRHRAISLNLIDRFQSLTSTIVNLTLSTIFWTITGMVLMVLFLTNVDTSFRLEFKAFLPRDKGKPLLPAPQDHSTTTHWFLPSTRTLLRRLRLGYIEIV